MDYDIKSFEVFTSVQDIKDSLELDSGTVICELTRNDGSSVSIRVCGEVRIFFKDEIYKTPSEFPKELTERVRSLSVYDYCTDDCFVDYSNWFEAFYNGSFCESDVIEISGMSNYELLIYCAELIKEFERQRNGEGNHEIA